MFGDMGKMMQQVKDMKENMKIAQQELQAMTIEGSSKGSEVIVKINGEMDIQNISISPDLLSKNIADVEKAVTVAVKDAITKAKDVASSKLGKLTGGLKLPGM